jgi:hypothetical protein
LLAALDAVLWPAAWVAAAALAPIKTGVVGPLIIALAVLFAVLRLHRALLRNERYWFATWRWGKVLGALLLIGMVLESGRAFPRPVAKPHRDQDARWQVRISQCVDNGRDEVQVSMSERRHATARPVKWTASGNFFAAINL